jgi:pimeloyl-ACP methyl ester carboxylesterase
MERAFALGWLLRTYAFVLGYGFGRIPELEPRLDQFAQRLTEYVGQSDDDEIVVVGHSIGANVAVSAMARALQRNPELWRGPVPVSFMTLGGTIPMLGLMPTAEVFRNELAALADSEELRWVDVSAYEDAASFPLVNPVVASGIKAGQGMRPLVMDGSFKAMLEPRTYYKAVWNLFRMHFQYLMASERDVPHDYLAVTTDAVAFRERFGGPS